MPETTDAVATLADNLRKARYGMSYVQGVCCQAGVGMNPTSQDEDVLAIDCTVEFDIAPVRVQVKCSSDWTIGGGGLTFPLHKSWTEKWTRCFVPVYLVVVVVPPDFHLWMRHDSDGTFHGSAAFWVRIPPDVGRSIEVPKTQRLSKDTLTLWRNDLLAMYTPGGNHD